MAIRIAVLVSNHTEDAELVGPVDLWRRAGIFVKLISVQKKKNLVLQNGIKVVCDEIIARENFSKYKAIFLPGGKGRKDFANELLSQRFISFAIKNATNNQIWFLGICGAPEIYQQLGVLSKTQKIACHPDCVEGLRDYFVNKPVVVDGNMITATGIGSMIDFALTVIEKLISKEKAVEIARQIAYSWK